QHRKVSLRDALLAGMPVIPTDRFTMLGDLVAVTPPHGFPAIRALGRAIQPVEPYARLSGQRLLADLARLGESLPQRVHPMRLAFIGVEPYPVARVDGFH